jgi:ribosomal-protein-alanine N-acetyltransferase
VTRGVFISEATTADLDALVALDAPCNGWNERDFRSEMEPGNRARTLVARALGGSGMDVIGFCAYRLIADEIHVHNLGIAPAYRRQGLARLLLRSALHGAIRAGARQAILEVRAGNEPARLLYESEGFVIAQKRRAYYADPLEDAFVLSRWL